MAYLWRSLSSYRLRRTPALIDRLLSFVRSDLGDEFYGMQLRKKIIGRLLERGDSTHIPVARFRSLCPIRNPSGGGCTFFGGCCKVTFSSSLNVME